MKGSFNFSKSSTVQLHHLQSCSCCVLSPSLAWNISMKIGTILQLQHCQEGLKKWPDKGAIINFTSPTLHMLCLCKCQDNFAGLLPNIAVMAKNVQSGKQTKKSKIAATNEACPNYCPLVSKSMFRCLFIVVSGKSNVTSMSKLCSGPTKLAISSWQIKQPGQSINQMWKPVQSCPVKLCRGSHNKANITKKKKKSRAKNKDATSL